MKTYTESRRKYYLSHTTTICNRGKRYRKLYKEMLEWKRIHRVFKLGKDWKEAKETWEKMFNDQGGKCGICNRIFNKTPHVDHDHVTGKVRGLLCGECNKALGVLENSLQSVNDYLKRGTQCES